jgi:uncharacterized protein
MKEELQRRSLIPQGWLRALLFSILYFLASVLIFKPLEIVYSLLMHKDLQKGPALDEKELDSVFFLGLTVFGLLVISLLLVFLFRRFVDRKTFGSLGFGEAPGIDAWAGLFLAPAILGAGSILLYLSKHLRWTDIEFNPNALGSGFGIMLIVAVYEELVFRGYILANLMDSFNKWLALVFSALLFTAFHLGNPGMDIVTISNIFVAGLILGINYIYTRNLWFSFLFHLAWNFLQGPILGFKVSGINLPSLLLTELKGDALITGGNFGFEGSVFDLGLSLIVVLILFLYYEKRQRNTAIA